MGSEAARSKAYICGRLLPGIAGTNPAGGVDVCILWKLYVVQVKAYTKGWSLFQGKPAECVCVIKSDQAQQ